MGDDDVCYNLNRPAKPPSLLYHIRVYSKIRYWAPCLARALRNAFPKASWWETPHGQGSGRRACATHLRGDTGVVGAWHPEGVVPQHTVPAAAGGTPQPTRACSGPAYFLRGCGGGWWQCGAATLPPLPIRSATDGVRARTRAHVRARHALLARIRRAAHQRTRQSSMAVVSAWPRCSEPVTFGGGMTMTKLQRRRDTV